jgi:addiction module RelB/DinJ family antitoxin
MISMATTNINFKVDLEIKEQAQEVFKAMGLNMTTAFNMFLVKTIQDNKLPFQPTAKKDTQIQWEELSPIIQERIDIAISQIKTGKSYSIQELKDRKKDLKEKYEKYV